MSYDIQELEQRYEELEEYEREGLEMYFDNIVDFLEDTDRDWVKKDYIAEEKDLSGHQFASAYNGFIKLFEAPRGTGNTFAFYKMDYEEIVAAGVKLDLRDQEEILDDEAAWIT